METPDTNTPEIIDSLPEGVARDLAATAAQATELHAGEQAQRVAEADAAAQSINAGRPEGWEPTLPTGETPASTELTASTVRSRF